LIDSSTKAERVLHSEQPEKTDSAEKSGAANSADIGRGEISTAGKPDQEALK
jgi:hypothetical protein